MEQFVGDIKSLTLDNQSYRKVIETGTYTQIVLMSLKPLQDIPEETHSNVDQIINIVKGKAKIIVNKKSYKLTNNMIIMIKAGSKHYVKNTSKTSPLKLYTIYSPPEHPYNLIQAGGSQNILYQKYLTYKAKYLSLKNYQSGGAKKMKKKRPIKGGDNTSMDIKPKYIENVSEPWFTLISLGLKTVEGRKNKGRFKEMEVGDIVQWNNNDFMPRTILTKITDKAEYKTFAEYLETEGLDNCLPGIPSLEHGLSVYFKYFTKEDEAEFGVVAIRLELVK